MAQQKGTKVYNTFVGGLVTEAGPLTFPENASADELNMEISRKGNRRRRLGIDYEPDYTQSSFSFDEAAIGQSQYLHIDGRTLATTLTMSS